MPCYMKNISQTDNLTIYNAASFIPILSFFNNYIATPLKLCSQLHCQAPDDLRRRIFLAPGGI